MARTHIASRLMFVGTISRLGIILPAGIMGVGLCLNLVQRFLLLLRGGGRLPEGGKCLGYQEDGFNGE
jgi:hypothetical protein